MKTDDFESRRRMLIRFLKEHNSYKEFITNLEKDWNKLEDLNSMVKKRCEKKIFSEITSAFIWTKTKQGYEYWDNLDEEWRNLNRLKLWRKN